MDVTCKSCLKYFYQLFAFTWRITLSLKPMSDDRLFVGRQKVGRVTSALVSALSQQNGAFNTITFCALSIKKRAVCSFVIRPKYEGRNIRLPNPVYCHCSPLLRAHLPERFVCLLLQESLVSPVWEWSSLLSPVQSGKRTVVSHGDGELFRDQVNQSIFVY